MLTDHVSGVDTKVTKCFDTLASNSFLASSSVAANVVQELEDQKHRKKKGFFNIPEPDASNSEADHKYVSILCNFESISSWQESAKQMQTIASAV